MKIMKKIEVVDYNPNWQQEFEAIKVVLLKQLADETVEIEHIGSTAVPGLKAKPVLDIDITIEDKNQLQTVISKLATLGYKHRGDLGITGREAFKRTSDDIPQDGSGRIWQKHHLYVCIKGNTALSNHLKLRDYLRQHPAKAVEYGELKSQLAQQFTYNMDAYIDGKTDFIVAILNEMNVSKEAQALIIKQNRIP